MLSKELALGEKIHAANLYSNVFAGAYAVSGDRGFCKGLLGAADSVAFPGCPVPEHAGTGGISLGCLESSAHPAVPALGQNGAHKHVPFSGRFKCYFSVKQLSLICTFFTLALFPMERILGKSSMFSNLLANFSWIWQRQKSPRN